MNFFDKNFFQNLFVSLFIFVFSLFLGINTLKTTYNGKGWKIVVIISWFLILGGIYMFVRNFPNGQFNNMYTGMGLLMLFVGLILKFFGKFFIWWHH